MIAPASAVLAAWLVALATAASGPGRDDAADAARIRLGDRAAFRRFFDATHADLLAALRRRIADPAVADDLAQQAYVWIWEHRDRIDPERSLRGLLFRIVVTRALNHVRDTARLDPLADLDRIGDEAGDAAALADLRAALADAVAALPERRRQTFTLCFVDGLSHREAAEVMDISPKTVEHQMGHALKAIRARLLPFLDERDG